MLSGYTRVQRFLDSLSAIRTDLNSKQGALTITTIGSSGASTLVGNTLNIPEYAGGGSQTFQQVLTTGSTLTQSNTINNGGYVQIASNGKNQFDSIGINPSAYLADTIWFSGTSITAGVGASTLANRFSTLTSNKLGAVESNHGCSGCKMYVEGINSTNLGYIPTYNSTKYRWMVLEWGVNDMQLGITDTATYAAAYLRYIDTAIARGWPAVKILILSPSFIDSTASVASTWSRQTSWNLCTQKIAERRGTLYLDIFYGQVAKGAEIFFTDGVHPNDYGVSAAYINPITAKLGDSVRVQGQQVQINGLTELQRLKIKTTDTANYKAILIGIDSSGNVVRFDKTSFIENSINKPQPQSANINITGKAFFGVTTPTVEKIQISGTLKTTYGRFTGAGVSGMTGSSTEIGYYGGAGYIDAFNRTGAAATPLALNPSGGQILVGGATASGAHKIIVLGGTTQYYGQFTGALPASGSGVEIGAYSGYGYFGAFNRTGGAELDLTFMPLGGKTFFGALAASGTNLWQFTGAGHFTTGLNVGSSSTPTSMLQTTSLATAYTATATSITLSASHYTVNVTATGQTITLPTAASITGRIYTIKLTASGTGTVATTSSQTIDGSTTYSLSAQYKYVTVQSDGANWIIIANN